MAFSYPTDEEWLASLPQSERERALELTEKFRTNGCVAPEGWVRSEMEEDISQFARYLILSRIWRSEIDHPWSATPETWIKEYSRTVGPTRLPVFDDAAVALQRFQESGVSAKDLGAIARLVAYSTAFGVLNLLDEGSDRFAAGDTPGWSLRETDAEGNLTGRDIGGLHESLLEIHEDSLKADSGKSA